MCNILKTPDCRVKRMKIWGTRIDMYCICEVLFMPDSLSSVWVHSVHFAKFPMLRFSKGCSSHSFCPISAKLYGKNMVIKGEYRLVNLLAICQTLKILWHFEHFLTEDHMRLEISKHYSSFSFHPMSAKLYFFGNQPSFKISLAL